MQKLPSIPFITLPIVSDARICHASTNAAVSTHEGKDLAAKRAGSEASHSAVVDEEWSFRHHDKVQDCKVQYQEVT